MCQGRVEESVRWVGGCGCKFECTISVLQIGRKHSGIETEWMTPVVCTLHCRDVRHNAFLFRHHKQHHCCWDPMSLSFLLEGSWTDPENLKHERWQIVWFWWNGWRRLLLLLPMLTNGMMKNGSSEFNRVDDVALVSVCCHYVGCGTKRWSHRRLNGKWKHATVEKMLTCFLRNFHVFWDNFDEMEPHCDHDCSVAWNLQWQVRCRMGWPSPIFCWWTWDSTWRLMSFLFDWLDFSCEQWCQVHASQSVFSFGCRSHWEE